MVYGDIITAIESKLASFATTEGVSVAWPNRIFEPSDDPYLAGNLLPSETSVGGLAAGSYQDYQGIYQVDVRVRKNTGTTDQRRLIEGLLTEFSKATLIDINDTRVIIEKSWSSGAFEIGDNWMSTPVSIQYRVIK